MTFTEILGKIFTALFYIGMVALVLWFLISWYEVITNNLTPDYPYSTYNFFKVIFWGDI